MRCFRFPGGLDSKRSACNVGDLSSIPGFRRSPGEGHGNPLQYSCLENPHGQRSLAGCNTWGHKELDMTEWLSTWHTDILKSKPMEEKGSSRTVYSMYFFFFFLFCSGKLREWKSFSSKNMLIIITRFFHLTSASVIFLFDMVNNQFLRKSHDHTGQDHIQKIVNRTWHSSMIHSSFPRSSLVACFWGRSKLTSLWTTETFTWAGAQEIFSKEPCWLPYSRVLLSFPYS